MKVGCGPLHGEHHVGRLLPLRGFHRRIICPPGQCVLDGLVFGARSAPAALRFRLNRGGLRLRPLANASRRTSTKL